MKFKSPVYHVIAVPIEKIVPNTYNPKDVYKRQSFVSGPEVRHRGL